MLLYYNPITDILLPISVVRSYYIIVLAWYASYYSVDYYSHACIHSTSTMSSSIVYYYYYWYYTNSIVPVLILRSIIR
jgi:hypothetical protein